MGISLIRPYWATILSFSRPLQHPFCSIGSDFYSLCAFVEPLLHGKRFDRLGDVIYGQPLKKNIIYFKVWSSGRIWPFLGQMDFDCQTLNRFRFWIRQYLVVVAIHRIWNDCVHEGHISGTYQ